MKKFKMPTAYTILFSIIAVVAVLTWIIPAGVWEEGIYSQIDSNPQGLYNILSAPVMGFFDAIDIALFVIIIGGFLGIVIKTGALDAGIGRLLKKFEGSEQLLIPILMILFGIGGSTYGMAEETIAFYPIIIVVFLAAGYDVVTAVMVVLLGAGVGVLGSTVNPFAIGAASEAAGTSIGLGIGHRFILFLLVEGVAIYWTMKYAAKVKADPSKSIVADLHEKHLKHFLHGKEEQAPELTSTRKWVLFLFAFTFIVMIIGVIPWAWKFDILFFDNIYNQIADIPVLGKLLGFTSGGNWDQYDQGGVVALGDWWFGQLNVWFFIMSLVIGLTAKLKEEELVSTFVQGARDLLGVALIIGVSRGIKVVMVAGGMDATILYWGSEALNNLGKIPFVIMTYVFYLPMSFLIPSTSGLAGATMPIMGPLGELVFNTTDGTGASIVITAYSAASGVINLITPTSGVVMGGLAIAMLPYDRWFKHVFKFLGILSLIIVVILSVVTILA
jgi:uncharacterized ion transporter superfamily protein YfcC